MPVGGAPLAMGCGRGGGADETSGGETPTGRGGKGSGGTPGRGVAMGAMGGMPELETEREDDQALVCTRHVLSEGGGTITIYELI